MIHSRTQRKKRGKDEERDEWRSIVKGKQFEYMKNSKVGGISSNQQFLFMHK